MSLPHALLGLLKYRSTTGYDIKTAFESSINFFWKVSLPQIYRTLNSMEKKGWLAATIKHQEGKPNKKIYRVTEEGEMEFQKWLGQTSEMPIPKDELLIKVFFGNFMNREELIDHITERRRHSVQFLQTAEELGMPSMDYYAQQSGAAEDRDFWLLTLDFGRRRAQMTIEWCDAALKFLEKKIFSLQNPVH